MERSTVAVLLAFTSHRASSHDLAVDIRVQRHGVAELVGYFLVERNLMRNVVI